MSGGKKTPKEKTQIRSAFMLRVPTHLHEEMTKALKQANGIWSQNQFVVEAIYEKLRGMRTNAQIQTWRDLETK